MPGQRYNDAKKEIRSVLLTYKEPVSLEEFLKTYRNLLGERLPSRTLGYSTDIDFLKSMPDVVHLSASEIGRIVLSGIADASSQHIQKLVSKQRKINKPKRKLPQSEPFNMPVSVRELRPYVPGPLRAEILELAAMFPDGVTLSAFVLAYHKKFNKYLSLEKGLETLEHMIESVKELDLKTVRGEKKIYCKNITKKFEDRVSFLPQVKDNDHGGNIRKANATKVHKSGISTEIQKNFQLVLQKCPEGILAIHFPPLYENVTGQSFDLHELGYNSILELADALPDIFKRILDPCDDKNWILLPANSTLRFDYRSEKIRQTEDSPLSDHKGPSPLKLREGIPADVASPHLHYVLPKMPENITLNEYLPIFVSAIVNPSLFWFQLQTDDIFEKFEAFENDLGLFYSSYTACRYGMNDADVIIGAICVVQCPDDKQWYRAVIKSIPSVNLINVLFVDYGSRENIPRANLRYLRNKYHGYPAAAFRAELAGLKPPKNASTWDVRAQQRFIQLCDSASLMAYLKPVSNDSFSTYLCDTSGETDIHINDTLIKEGHAEFCYGNQFNENGTSNELTSSVISNGVGHIMKDNFVTKSPSANTSSYDTNNHLDQGVKSGNKDDFITDTKMLPVNRKLSFSMDKQSCDTNSGISYAQKPRSCKRYVKPLKLCEDTKIHIINMKDKPYVSIGDLSKLFWKDKNMTYLAERLKYKEVNVPSVEITKEDNSDIFQQCEWYKIPDFKNSVAETSLLTLYPLEWAFNILNIFGHPSVCLRLAIQNEIRNFSPQDSIWKEFCVDEMCDLSNIEKEIEEKLGKLCLYDLKAQYEALKIKRLKLLKVDNSCPADEIKRIEQLQSIIERRMKHIETICSQYSSYS